MFLYDINFLSKTGVYLDDFLNIPLGYIFLYETFSCNKVTFF